MHVNLDVSQLNIQPNKYGDGDWKLYSKSSKSKITKPLRNSVEKNNKKIIDFLNNWKVFDPPKSKINNSVWLSFEISETTSKLLGNYSIGEYY